VSSEVPVFVAGRLYNGQLVLMYDQGAKFSAKFSTASFYPHHVVKSCMMIFADIIRLLIAASLGATI
jgi:hypothetical protein